MYIYILHSIYSLSTTQQEHRNENASSSTVTGNYIEENETVDNSDDELSNLYVEINEGRGITFANEKKYNKIIDCLMNDAMKWNIHGCTTTIKL